MRRPQAHELGPQLTAFLTTEHLALAPRSTWLLGFWMIVRMECGGFGPLIAAKDAVIK
jgi:hypothetical protein